MARWKKILSGIALTAVVAGGTFYWRTTRSGPALVSADANIKLVEKPCDAALAPARCGVVIVPLDYNNPKGKTIEVGFVNFPAISFGNNPTLQLIGDEPGHPITNRLKDAGSAAIAAIRLVFRDCSMLFIEPRGFALSTRLDCPAYRNLKVHPYDLSLKQLCADQIGSDTQHYTTENTARDFEQVRRALGIAELDLYGFSYGTNLSAVYASLFPKHVRTLGFDGAMPLTTQKPFEPEHYAAMKRQIQQFCERSAQCKTDEVFQAIAWAANELKKAPRPLGALAKGDRFYLQPLQLDAATLAGLTVDWPRLIEDEKTEASAWRLPFISALLKACRQKNWAELEALTADRLSTKKTEANDPNLPHTNALFNTISCQDWTVAWKRTSTLDQRRIEYKANSATFDRENPNAFTPFSAAEWGMRRGGIGYYQMNINCPVQKTALPSQSEQTFTWPDSLPVLVLNGDYDFQTVNEDAERAVAQFKNAQFARFKHHGHAILPGSLCASQLLREFLDKKRVADPMKCYEADAAGVSLEKGKEK
jgi:pimeloyl-ACP methyl ester carboxylesterase